MEPTSSRRPTVVLLIVTLGAIRTTDARCADEPMPPNAAARVALDDLQLASAAPDAPFSGIGWRSGVRGRVGVAIPVAADDRWLFRLQAAIETYNDGGSEAFPYQFWRGMLAARLTHRWTLGLANGPRAFALGAGIEHESDHETNHGPVVFRSFVYTDSVSAHGDVLFAWNALTLLTELTFRGHFLDCTDVSLGCGDNDTSSKSFEADLDAIARTGGPPIDDGLMHACGAIHLGYVAPNGSVVREARAAIDIGACVRAQGRGEWELVGEGRVGSDVGLHRGRAVNELGISVRWII
jgi:hypothetical protein